MLAIDLIIFDCDGVLVDSEVIGNQIYAKMLTELGFPHTAEECNEKYLGMSNDSVMALYASNGTPLPSNYDVEVHRREQEALSRDLEAISGVAETLDKLETPYCLASSGTWEKIDRSLTKTGLDRFFSGNRFCFEQVVNGKPAPDLFLFAAKTMGFAPERCVVVEDSRAGVQAGVAAGMTVVGFTGGSHIPLGHGDVLRRLGAHHILEDMRRLPELLARL